MKAKAIRSICAGSIYLSLTLPFLARVLSSDHRTIPGLTPLFPAEQQSVLNAIPGVSEPSFFNEKGFLPQKHVNDCYPKKNNWFTKTELSGKRE
jgi:hypothetical protein